MIPHAPTPSFAERQLVTALADAYGSGSQMVSPDGKKFPKIYFRRDKLSAPTRRSNVSAVEAEPP
jgi:hypothetical protein